MIIGQGGQVFTEVC